MHNAQVWGLAHFTLTNLAPSIYEGGKGLFDLNVTCRRKRLLGSPGYGVNRSGAGGNLLAQLCDII